MSGLLGEMKRVKQKVDALILEELLPGSSPVGEVDFLYRMMKDYPSRPGKGMRPFLCITACKAAGGREDDALLTAACIELFQNWILIHDDIEDGSELRRGEPALHRKFPEALALNAGDALHARMWGALLSNSKALGPQMTISIMAEFAKMVNETTEGQHMELSWVQNSRWDLTEGDYFLMCAKKTSWYTVASPCRLGAMVAKADWGVVEKLASFGTKLGIAFQIQDDALNLTGDEKKYGKARSDDLIEGKRTLILLHLMRAAQEPERESLRRIMNKPRAEKTQEDIAYVLGLIEKHDAVGYARKRAAELLKESMSILGEIDWKGDSESVAMLGSFAKFAVDREW